LKQSGYELLNSAKKALHGNAFLYSAYFGKYQSVMGGIATNSVAMIRNLPFVNQTEKICYLEWRKQWLKSGVDPEKEINFRQRMLNQR